MTVRLLPFVFIFILSVCMSGFAGEDAEISGRAPAGKGEIIETMQERVDILNRFDHEKHDAKAFKSFGFACDRCHNFKLDSKTNKLMPNEKLVNTAMRVDLKTICHECHNTGDAKYVSVTQTCVTCHRSAEDLKTIKPRNHANVAWKSAHASNARIDGENCMACHVTSQCVQCHQRRNDIEMKNHSRNFRFTHSIVARMQPHRCDSCHTRSFCSDCHRGKK